MGIIEFVQFIEDIMLEKDVSQAELSRRSGVSPAQISKIFSMQSSPSVETALNITDALDIPLDVALDVIGVRPIKKDNQIRDDIAVNLFGLNDTQLDEVNKFIEWIKERDRQRSRPKLRYGKKREGQAPPATVNKE